MYSVVCQKFCHESVTGAPPPEANRVKDLNIESFFAVTYVSKILRRHANQNTDVIFSLSSEVPKFAVPEKSNSLLDISTLNWQNKHVNLLLVLYNVKVDSIDYLKLIL